MSVGMKFEGKNANIFDIWIALCRYLLFKVIVHENAPSIGEYELSDLRSDL